MKLKVGKPAPDFKLPDQAGKMHSLKNYRGRWVLIYFYPKDNTTGCTKQACAIRDTWGDFKKAKLEVLGVSIDPIKSHDKFAKKYDLPFTLLADEKKYVVKKYGVWGKKKFMGREYMGTFRTSFLIDPKGVIAAIYEKVNPETHADMILDTIKRLRR
jgi:peroxiredoxin Q/BCP